MRAKPLTAFFLNSLAFAIAILTNAHAMAEDIVARIADRAVTLQELDQAGGSSLYDAALQLHETRVRSLYQLLSNEVLAREAIAKNLSVADLLNAQTNIRATAVTDVEIDAFLKNKGKDLDGQDPKVRRQASFYLASRRSADEKRAYISKLFTKYNVRISLGSPPAPPVEQISGPVEPFLGNAAAPVTLVVFSDYLCPYCRDLSHTLNELLATRPKEIKIVYRHFPVHDQSAEFAQAVLCAADQNRFSDYHNSLFTFQSLEKASPEAIAKQLNLDTELFQTCLRKEQHAGKVQADIDEGKRLNIQGTPTIFVNGVRLRGAQSLDRLNAQIRESLKATAQVGTAQR